MIYKVALVEFGTITHVWRFSCYCQAVDHLSKLLSVYEEVNEVCPVLLKVGQCEADVDFINLLIHYAHS